MLNNQTQIIWHKHSFASAIGFPHMPPRKGHIRKRRCPRPGKLCWGAESPWTLHTGGQGAGGTAHLVGGNDPLASMLEQLLIPPVRVLLSQPPGTQVVVAKPQQAQGLQEGLPVPAPGPEGCMHVGEAGQKVDNSLSQGSPDPQADPSVSPAPRGRPAPSSLVPPTAPSC